MAATWQEQLQPLSLQFASQLHSFGTTAAAQYSAVEGGIESLLQGDRADVRARLQAALHAVHAQARDAQSVATRLSAGISDQANAARDLYHQLKTQTDNYEQAVNTNDADVRRLRADIDRVQAEVNDHQSRYNEYVTIAATTVTYAWIPLFGWIAGGAVAGTYGQKAVEEKRQLDSSSERLAVLRGDLSRELEELYRLQQASGDSRALTDAFANVTPLMGQIQGIWDALASDLDGIGDSLEDDLDNQRVLSLKLALQAAARGWADVAEAADAYAANSALNVVEPRFFGRYTTQVGYGGGIYPENHELVISSAGVTVSGAAVVNPIFSVKTLRFSGQTDARRDGKPAEAAITFTAGGFTGSCCFPGEGPIEWYGTKA